MREEKSLFCQNMLLFLSKSPVFFKLLNCYFPNKQKSVCYINFELHSEDSKQMQEETTHKSKTNGRWTQQEHRKFLIGVQLFGKDWKKISEFVTTRNGSQIRSHAQKYFMKINKKKKEGEEKRNYMDDCLSSGSFRSKQNLNENQQSSQMSSISDPLFWNKMFEINKSNDEFCLWDYIDQNGKKKQYMKIKQDEFQSFQYTSSTKRQKITLQPIVLNSFLKE